MSLKKTFCILLSMMLVLLSGCGADLPDDPPSSDGGSQMSADTGQADTDTEITEDAPESREDMNTDAAQQDMNSADQETDAQNGIALSPGITIPELERKEFIVPDTEAMRFADNLKVGWNLGNTFDAYNDGPVSDELSIETAWQSDKTTRETIHGIRELGFSSIRIPVSWHNHVSGDVEISDAWLSRVDEVIGWACDEGLYVIVNIHHDNHPEAKGIYPDKAHLEQSKHYIERIWTQLSARFEKYDEHLIFEGMNEPRLVGHEKEWWYDIGNKDCREATECINELNQLFVDTVRASGGNNAVRYLMCPGYDASPEGALTSDFHLPEDKGPEEGRIMLSVHAYTPYSFALESPGVSAFDAASTEDTRDINSFMGKLYLTYVHEGIPVVIGEFGAQNKNGNLQDRVNYAAYYVNAARQRGIPCLWWDNNAFTGSGELFGIYGRKDPEKTTQDIIAAMMAYGD